MKRRKKIKKKLINKNVLSSSKCKEGEEKKANQEKEQNYNKTKVMIIKCKHKTKIPIETK